MALRQAVSVSVISALLLFFLCGFISLSSSTKCLQLYQLRMWQIIQEQAEVNIFLFYLQLNKSVPCNHYIFRSPNLQFYLTDKKLKCQKWVALSHGLFTINILGKMLRSASTVITLARDRRRSSLQINSCFTLYDVQERNMPLKGRTGFYIDTCERYISMILLYFILYSIVLNQIKNCLLDLSNIKAASILHK